MSKKLFAVALILSFTVAFAAGPSHAAGGEALRSITGWETAPVDDGGVSWFSAPKETPNGWYWMYDNLESGPPFDDPILPGFPSWSNFWVPIHDSVAPLAPYNDDPFEYALEDSFWYYGHWYKPGDKLYISPDGWISFDPAALYGAPDPPITDPPFPVTDDPNAIIAPLWQDMNPTQTPDPSDDNRVYYMYRSLYNMLVVEWHNTEGNTNTHTYDFELHLTMAGQQQLVTWGACGVVFSYHFIHFLYNTSSNGWTADNGKTGIEDQAGEHGIYYEGTLANQRVIRAGYKRVFKHDLQAYIFVSPGPMVLRWTKIEPAIVVRNIGTEVEHFPLFLDIYDDSNDSLVYSHNVSGFDLMPGQWDTMVCPCWQPGEIGTTYRKVAYPILERDSCKHNDTLIVNSFVHCDDTFRYAWNWADEWLDLGGWGILQPIYMLTWYGADDGVLVTGGRAYIEADPVSNPGWPQMQVFEAQNGCGQTNASLIAGRGDCETYEFGWNSAIFPGFGIWVTAAHPGGIFAGSSSKYVYPDSPGMWVGWYYSFGMDPWPQPHPCYQGSGPGRGANIDDYGAFNWGTYTDGLIDPLANYYTCPHELYVHLGFGDFPLSPMPAPPCYYDNPHDLTAYQMKEPPASLEYLEAGVSITPEIGIANIGRQAEPDAGFFKAKFFAVNLESGDTVYQDSSLITEIGWLGDDTDDPDSLYGSFPPWIPEGICKKWAPGDTVGLPYELIGLVKLGEVGPDESDHCPYNDTIRRWIRCLLSHDVGVDEVVLEPGPDDPPDHYDAGSVITITATVDNYGSHEEHDVPVRCEITDAPADTLVYNNLRSVEFLDWRGNPYENPYTVEVTFPNWTTPSENRFDIEVRTELPGDMCPDNDFEVTSINTGIEETEAGLPFALEAITPNPFLTSTTVSFALPYTTNVSLKVYDITGKLVTTLVSGNQNPGRHSVVWNGTDDAGRSVAQGIYLVRMDAKDFTATKKVVLY